MAKIFDYQKKFQAIKETTLFANLPQDQQEFVQSISLKYFFTFQELKKVVTACIDLNMWGETSLIDWWNSQGVVNDSENKLNKKQILAALEVFLDNLRSQEKEYPESGFAEPKLNEDKPQVLKDSPKKIYGLCPVASDQTICCQLWTIDAVENCPFACSYCTIQTFYTDQFVFDKSFAEKLKKIPVDPNRFYHFGSGQSSDSLVWGNRYGMLDSLCQFASDHPNILLELKTKSDKIDYFSKNCIPDNIVISWTLNTETIIKNEENFTASLNQRIDAARIVSDKGIKVAFHFHPMVFYKGWDSEYAAVVRRLLKEFQPQEVAFISFGSVTLIKPVIQKIRKLSISTKILQMEMVTDPHGKMTYPDEIKIKMFKMMYETFSPWRDKVFIYLCMEKSSIWKSVFGHVYENNDEFEQDYGLKTMSKINIEK